jgi:hypothetical protein
VPIIGNISIQILIALRAIKQANLRPSWEMDTKLNLTKILPGTVRGIIIKKSRIKTATHLRFFSTKEKGIRDRNTRTIAKTNPAEADKTSGRRAIDNIKKEKEISLIRGSQE